MIDLIIIHRDCIVTFTLKDTTINKPVLESIGYIDLILCYPTISSLIW